MSSPRGLDAGGMGDIGVGLLTELLDGEGGDRARVWVGDSGGLCGVSNQLYRYRRGSNIQGIVSLNGGFRTFRYMLNDLSALFACGTYLRARLISHTTIAVE